MCLSPRPFSLQVCVGSKCFVWSKSKLHPPEIIIKSTRLSRFLLDKIYLRVIFAGEREGLGMRLILLRVCDIGLRHKVDGCKVEIC